MNSEGDGFVQSSHGQIEMRSRSGISGTSNLNSKVFTGTSFFLLCYEEANAAPRQQTPGQTRAETRPRSRAETRHGGTSSAAGRDAAKRGRAPGARLRPDRCQSSTPIKGGIKGGDDEVPPFFFFCLPRVLSAPLPASGPTPGLEGGREAPHCARGATHARPKSRDVAHRRVDGRVRVLSGMQDVERRSLRFPKWL